MPAPRDPKDYGPEYEQLLLHAHEALQSRAEFTVQFASPTIANRIQAKFRAYVRALKASTTRPDLCALCVDVSTRVAGSALIWFRAENSEDCVAIRAALGLSRGFSDTNSAGVIVQSGHMEKLKRIRERKK